MYALTKLQQSMGLKLYNKAFVNEDPIQQMPRLDIIQLVMLCSDAFTLLVYNNVDMCYQIVYVDGDKLEFNEDITSNTQEVDPNGRNFETLAEYANNVFIYEIGSYAQGDFC